MDFKVQKYISNFVQNQFPQFYKEEGTDFILFTKAYFEWLEQNGEVVGETRNLMGYRDIDTTLEKFLEFFQKKYLYGIPFNVISNKRFLLKHILDVYRSKGTINSYKLLFKLIYDEDIDVYLPGKDILKPSDGTWVDPKYIELTQSDLIEELVGKPVVGVPSGTTAIIESVVAESYNNDIVYVAHISNILPKGGTFEIGEKIVLSGQQANASFVIAAPSVVGSLDSMTITNGGSGFKIGDVIKVVSRGDDNERLSYGVEGYLRIDKVGRAFGTLNFDVVKGGAGYAKDAHTFVYVSSGAGSGGSFQVGTLTTTQQLSYNTDMVYNYLDTLIDATAYAMPEDPTANLTSQIGTTFNYANNTFGSVYQLTEVLPGNNYTTPPNVFVRSTYDSKELPGTISYNTTSNTVTGTSTKFTDVFVNNDIISLKANNSLSNSIEYQVIKQVVSDTQVILFGPPSLNSTASAKHYASPAIFPSNYALYESYMNSPDGSINGLNANVTAQAQFGENVVISAVAVDSGRAYVQDEIVKAYLYGAIDENLKILAGGSGYTNGDIIVFSGGAPGSTASGFVSTDSSGVITSTTLANAGSGYNDVPQVRIKSSTGSGAAIAASLQEFNKTSSVIGRVNKSGVGRGRGFWKSTDSFLNSDKYIQDSNYYQDFSYEIKSAQTLDKYKNILYNTFHSAGSELFGKYFVSDLQSSNSTIASETVNIS